MTISKYNNYNERLEYRWLCTLLLCGMFWSIGFNSQLMAAHEKAEGYPHAELERKAGNYVSAQLRRAHVLINDPVMTDTMRKIVHDLLNAAEAQDREREIYILALPDVSAFALSNGDIFVCSGLLDALETRDELAWVLSHEIDHLVQHDTITRLHEIRKAENTRETIMYLTAIGGGVAGPLIGVAAAGGVWATYTSSSAYMTSQIVGYSVAGGISSLGSTLGSVTYSAMVEGYSQKQELRADKNGAKYAYAAGYNASAALSVFTKLQQLEAYIETENNPIASNLIGTKLGLDRRIKEMKTMLQELGVKAPANSK